MAALIGGSYDSAYAAAMNMPVSLKPGTLPHPLHFFGVSLFIVLVSWSSALHAEVRIPLPPRIDQLVEKGNIAQPPELAGDADFLRRIFLDLAGTIPSGKEARSFLEDPDPDKRIKIIDNLLTRREHFHHLTVTFDTWIMERRTEIHVKGPGWRDFLRESFAANKPYDQLVREILAADGTEPKNRDASRFYLARLGEPNLISRDVGRVFFGQDLQCAQCHDHPTISDYLQRDYYGMFAFFGRTYLFQPDRKKPAVLAEKADGGGEFKSVFTSVESTSLPRLIRTRLEFPDPVFNPGQEYKVKPDPKKKTLQPIPKYSRREQIVKNAAASPAFSRNIANRLWAHMMGRGLVEPLDFHHASNPPVHPELLDLLAAEFVGMKYDIRKFLRSLALTKTYQRKFEMPVSLQEQGLRIEENLTSLEAEEERLQEISLAAAKAFDTAKTVWNESGKEASAPESELAAAEKKQTVAVDGLRKAQEAFDKAKSDLEKIPISADRKTDPKTAKLRSVADAKQKAVDSAQVTLEKAKAEVAKLTSQVEPARKKLAAATARLESARARFESDKRTWKLALRKVRDARALIDYVEAIRESAPVLEKANRLGKELDTLKREFDSRSKLAADLKRAFENARAACEHLEIENPSEFDDDLIMAASVLGNRSQTAAAKADHASKLFSKKKTEFGAADALATKQAEKLQTARESLTGRWSNAFAVGSLSQLTPEQLALSMLRATGELEKYRTAGEIDFEKKLTVQKAALEKAAQAKKPAKKTEPLLRESDRARHIQDYIDSRVKSSTQIFVRLFGGQAGSPQGDFFATADQALFLKNSSTVRAWLRPSGENLGARLFKIEDPATLAEELYLSILTRKPDNLELASLKKNLSGKTGSAKSIAIQDLGWALLSSVEFRFKH